MSKFLFVVPPFAGHVNPTIGVAAELRERGHEVAWCGDTTVPLDPRPPELHGFAALKHLWERVLVPLAEAMLPGVRHAVTTFRPDVLVVDQQALAGAIVAQRLRLPWATSATTSGELTDPLATLPNVKRWRRDLLARLAPGPWLSPHLVLAFTTKALAGNTPDQVRFVGPIARPTTDTSFPWRWLDPARQLVYVTLGTVNAEASTAFLTRCVDALRTRTDLQAIVVGITEEPAPPHVLLARDVPQPELIARASVVVCHAGHNTVCESLAAGVPLVVAPIRDDQPVVADQVARIGAGVRLRFRHATDRHIGDAIDAVLTEPGYRHAAQRVGESFRRAGGAVAAADHLVELSCQPTVWCSTSSSNIQ